MIVIRSRRSNNNIPMDINVVLMVSVQHTFRHTHTRARASSRGRRIYTRKRKKTCRETTAELYI